MYRTVAERNIVAIHLNVLFEIRGSIFSVVSKRFDASRRLAQIDRDLSVLDRHS